MKICIPMEGTTVSQHFGHTPEFQIVTVNDGKIVAKETFKSPGHEPGLLPKMMSEFGITHVIAGGMGRKAQEMFEESKIRVYSGVSGSIDEAVRLLLEGKLASGENLCDHWTSYDRKAGDRAGSWKQAPFGSGYWGEHGLAFCIQAGDLKILYDTGQSGDVLLHNARLAGASLRGLDCIVLSRGHYDHSGGLQKVPEMNKGVRLALHPAAFEKKFARDQNMIKDIGLPPGLDYLEMNCSMAIQPGPSDLGSGISTTGEIERIMPYETPESNLLVEKEGLLVADQVCDDQSLILRVENKIILLCGRCKL